jgi:hypothetical protein
VAREEPLLKLCALLEDAVFALRQRHQLLLPVSVEHRVERLTGHALELTTEPLMLGTFGSHENTSSLRCPPLTITIL